MNNPLARRVKELDLLDNMDCTRLSTFTDVDAVRLKKYTAALAQIRGSDRQLHRGEWGQ